MGRQCCGGSKVDGRGKRHARETRPYEGEGRQIKGGSEGRRIALEGGWGVNEIEAE